MSKRERSPRSPSRAGEKTPIQMLHDRVLVAVDRDPGERRSSGGILIPATAAMGGRRLSWCRVVAVGPHVRTVEVDDRVLFDPEEQGRGRGHRRALRRAARARRPRRRRRSSRRQPDRALPLALRLRGAGSPQCRLGHDGLVDGLATTGRVVRRGRRPSAARRSGTSSPRRELDSKSTPPWCASAIERTMCRPSPVPWMACSVASEERKNRWNSRALLLERDAHAGVDDPQLGDVAGHLGGDARPYPAHVGELHRVADQVQHQPLEVGRVALEHDRLGGQVHLQRRPAPCARSARPRRWPPGPRRAGRSRRARGRGCRPRPGPG